MQAMTRSDKRRGGAEWEWEEGGDEGDEDGEAEGDHLPALPERGGANHPSTPCPMRPCPLRPPALPTRPLRRELQAGALLLRLVQVQPRLRTRAERLGHGPRGRLSEAAST
jgi:hypothetical protein